ncbi:hypothetical protein Tco_0648868 [Tanacetum coccineum]
MSSDWLLQDYVPGLEYPEYLALSDEEVPMEDQPYVVADSPIALSPGYVADSDPKEDSKDGPVDYPVNGGDGDDDESCDDDEEEEEASEEEEDEHLAPPTILFAPLLTMSFFGEDRAVTPSPLDSYTARIDRLGCFRESMDCKDGSSPQKICDCTTGDHVHGFREAWAHSVGLSSAVHYELQAYRTHTQMQDFRIASQESLVTTLITHVSSLQGHLLATLRQIQALQARGQTHVDDREGAGNST